MSIFSELGVREGKDRAKEEVLYNLAVCYGLAERRIAQILEPYGLTPVKMNALVMVKHVGMEEGLSQAEIGKRMIVSAGNITRLIDRLEKEKLVRRVEKKGDRRVKLVSVTPKGAQLIDRVWPVYKKEVEKIVSVLPAGDVATAGRVLGGLRERLQRESRED